MCGNQDSLSQLDPDIIFVLGRERKEVASNNFLDVWPVVVQATYPGRNLLPISTRISTGLGYLNYSPHLPFLCCDCLNEKKGAEQFNGEEGKSIHLFLLLLFFFFFFFPQLLLGGQEGENGEIKG